MSGVTVGQATGRHWTFRIENGLVVGTRRLSRLIDWRRVLTSVKLDTLMRWHRKGFQLFWRWKS